MAQFYVATTGDDASSGDSWANAKRTIQAAWDASTTDDEIYIGGGVFIANIATPTTTGGERRHFIGGTKGETVWDGGGLEYCFRFYYTSSQTSSFTRIAFRNADYGLRTNGPWSLTGIYVECTFEMNMYAAYGTGTGGPLSFTRCVFRGTGSGIYRYGAVDFYNCVFVDCGVYNPHPTAVCKAMECVFVSTGLAARWLRVNPATLTSRGNVFSVIDATRTVGHATIYTTIASWQTAMGLRDVGSFILAHPLIEPSVGNVNPPLQSPMSFAGNYGTLIGARKNAIALSGDLFNVPVLSTNLEQSDGAWILSSAGSGVFRSDVVDFLGSKQLYQIRLGLELGSAGQIATTTNGTESTTFRYRAAETAFVAADVLPAWNEIPIGEEIGMLARFCQVEVTLRTDGPT